MAYTVTSRIAANNGATASQTFTTASFTPSANSTLFVMAHAANNGNSTAHTWSISNTASLTFVGVAETQMDSFAGDANFSGNGVLYMATVGGSPSSMTITLDANSGNTDTFFYGVQVFDVTASAGEALTLKQWHQAASSFGSAGNGITNASLTVTLPINATNGNLVIVGFNADGTGGAAATTPTDWGLVAAISDAGVGGLVASRTDFTSAAVTCTDLGQDTGMAEGFIMEFGADKVPSFVAAGPLQAEASTTALGPVVIPVHATTDDILILGLMANGSTTFGAPATDTWTVLGTSIESNSDQSTEFYWARHDGSMTNPSSTTSATMSATLGGYGRIWVFRNCVTSGDPFEDVTMNGSPTSSTTPATATIDTTGTNRLAVGIVLVDDDNTWSSGFPPSGWLADGGLLSSTTGGDAMFDAIVRGVASASTVTGATIGTMSAADFWRTLTMALVPPVGTITGTAAINLAVFTTSTAGSTTSGTAAITLGSFTSSASGTSSSPNVSGTAAITLGSFTSSASGTHTPPPITGTAAITLAAFTTTAAGVLVDLLYPVSISNRKILDQTGGVFLIKSMSSWAMGQEGSDAEITDALEGLAALGFNCVTVAPFGVNNPEPGGGGTYDPFENDAGDPFFTGTPFQSSFGSGWASFDHLMDEATRLDMTVIVTMFLSHGSTGVVPQMTAASNAQMETFGNTLATRYAAYPNVIWHIMGDFDFDWNATICLRVDNYFKGIRAAETYTHLITAEPDFDRSAYDQFISQEGNGTTGYAWFHVDLNTPLRDSPDHESVVVRMENALGESGATTEAVWVDEPVYVNSTYYSGNADQQTREQNYSAFIENGCGINFGDELWWPCGEQGLFGGAVGAAWIDQLDANTTLEAGYCWGLVDEFCADLTWVQTSSFVTTGEGSGDTKAAQGFSDTAALAYFPNNRTIAVDTTILAGTNNVRLRWFDPVLNSYSTISASEGQQTGRSVTLPAARGDGTRDFVLVVDLITAVTGTVAVTLGSFTTTTAGSTTSGTAAIELGVFTSTASGTVTAPSTSGSAVITLGSFTTAATGSTTSGSAAVTLAPFTTNTVGTVVAFIGTSTPTLAPFTTTASGTVANPVTGTVAVTLGTFTVAASGAAVEPGGGFATIVLAAFTAAASGTVTPPALSGSGAVTLAPFTSTAAGTAIPPPVIGVAAIVLAAFIVNATEHSRYGYGTSTLSSANTTSIILPIGRPRR